MDEQENDIRVSSAGCFVLGSAKKPFLVVDPLFDGTDKAMWLVMMGRVASAVGGGLTLAGCLRRQILYSTFLATGRSGEGQAPWRS